MPGRSASRLAEVRRVVDEELTAHQRRIFVAVVVDQIPRDALAAGLGLQKNAIYKVIFDARRKIRRALVAKGYLEGPGFRHAARPARCRRPRWPRCHRRPAGRAARRPSARG